MKNKVIFGVVGIIIVLIALFFIVGGMAPAFIQAGYQISTGNNCSLVSGVIYEEARDICINPSDITVNWTITEAEPLPLASLFSPSGVVFILFMIALFITAIFLVMKFKVK